MKLRYFFLGLIFIGIFLLQYAFISSMPSPVNAMNLILVILIYILMMFGKEQAIFSGIVWGAIFDSMSALPFGLNLICFFLVIIISDLLLSRFFTNRSLYTFVALVVLATFMNFIFSGILVWIASRFAPGIDTVLEQSLLQFILSQTLMNLLAAILFFYATSILSRRFKPVFLSKSDK